jgi:hypothetical protein
MGLCTRLALTVPCVLYAVCGLHRCDDQMKLVDGLFLDCCREASQSFPDVVFEEMLIDNAVLKVGGWVVVVYCTSRPLLTTTVSGEGAWGPCVFAWVTLADGC